MKNRKQARDQANEWMMEDELKRLKEKEWLKLKKLIISAVVNSDKDIWKLIRQKLMKDS